MNISNFLRLLLVCFFTITSARAQSTSRILSPLPNFGTHGDGTIRPGEASYVTINTYQRGLAYNPATGNFIFIDRQADGGGTAAITGSIYVLDPLTGNTNLSFYGGLGFTLNTNGMAGGNYADTATAVSDDGVIYVANLVNNASTSPYIIYRWDNETNGNPPVIVYSGDPAPGITPRWGETMDIRGTGANTQIIIGSKTTATTPGTNVVIFTAGDASATNFIAHLLNTDLASSEAGSTAEPGMSVAFGAGNTFWTKHKSGAPLRQLSFDLATSSNATTIRVFGTNTFINTANLGPMTVDTNNNLMALADLSLPNSVRLYDISDLSKAPRLLDVKTFATSTANGSAGGLYMDFGGGKLYVHSMNNGLMALSVDTVTMPLPVWVTQPSGSSRLVEGKSAYFEALATQATSYQWQKNGSNLLGATGASLSLSNLLTSDSGVYSVNASNTSGITLGTSSATLNVVSSSNLFRLSPMWVSTVAGAVNAVNVTGTNYINQGGGGNTPNQRTIAYNALSNHLYMISRTNATSVNFGIFVINATNGQYLYNLKTNGITGGSIGLVSIGCGDDGSIYACNVDTTSTTSGVTAAWKLYRWADGGSNTLPTLVFTGEPTGQSGTPYRWGDAMSVRGSGVTTEIVIDNNNSTARYVAHLVPTDSSMATFISKFQLNNVYGTSIGRSLQWGANNGDGTYTIWQKRKATNLYLSTFNPANTFPDNIVGVQATYTGFPSTLGPVAVDAARNFVVGIDFNGNASTPDSVALFDITDPAAALFINRYNFSVNQFANGNFIGQVILTANYVFAIDGNNGLMAFTVSSGPATPPTILSQSGGLRLVTGSSGTLSISSPDASSYQWRRNGSNLATGTSSIYTISNAQLTDAGSYVVVLSNNSGATTSGIVNVTVVSTNDVYQLSQKWQYLPGTNSASTFTNYVTYNGGSGTPNERSIAYSSLSNQLYVVQKSGPDYAVHVLNPDTGVEQYLLNTTGIFFAVPALNGSSGLGIDAIGVAADGAIYASALTADACGCANPSGVWRLYRWANSDPATQPVQVFQGDPAGQSSSLRWGDVMSVRGSGLSTEILVNNNQGTFGAVLTPIDSSMASFTNAYFNQNGAGTPIGRSLQFATGSTNTLWQKRSNADIQLHSYDLANNSSTMVTNFAVFPSTFGPVAIDEARKIAVGINFSSSASTPDTLEMYDTSPPLTPTLLLSRYNFPINHQGNQNFIGQVLITANRVFAISGNNGLVAFDLVSPAKPQMTLSSGVNSVTISWPTSLTGYGLEGTRTLGSGWTNVTATVVTNNGQNTVTVGTTGAAQYFRLKK